MEKLNMNKNQQNETAVELHRVSESAHKKQSLNEQKNMIKENAKENNIIISKTWNIFTSSTINDKNFIDTLSEIFNYCLENDEVRYLYVSSLNRLSRNVRHLQTIIDQFEIINVSIVSCETPRFYTISKTNNNINKKYSYIY